MTCSVYILKSQRNNHVYIGSSVDPEQRESQHNNGEVKVTKNKGPWKLVFSQQFPSGKMARQVEYRLKKLKRRDIIERIVQERIIKMKV